MKVGDAAGFRKYYSFLLKCQSIIGGNKWNALDSPDSICMLLTKLPGQLRDRWNRECTPLEQGIQENLNSRI